MQYIDYFAPELWVQTFILFVQQVLFWRCLTKKESDRLMVKESDMNESLSENHPDV